MKTQTYLKIISNLNFSKNVTFFQKVRNYHCHLNISNIIVTLKVGEGHPNWYETVKLNSAGCHQHVKSQTEIDISYTKVDIKVECVFVCLFLVMDSWINTYYTDW